MVAPWTRFALNRRPSRGAGLEKVTVTAPKVRDGASSATVQFAQQDQHPSPPSTEPRPQRRGDEGHRPIGALDQPLVAVGFQIAFDGLQGVLVMPRGPSRSRM